MSDPSAARPELEQAIEQAAAAVAVQSQQFGEISAGKPGQEALGFGQLMDVEVEVTVEVGRTRMTLGALAKLAPGSLVELDREAHEPADILVNGKIVAQGEVVTIGENYGVRITRVVS